MVQSTAEKKYTEMLKRAQFRAWKELLRVQLPYKLHLQKLRPGLMLDIGCGLGRNLIHVAGVGVGIDHNPASVEIAKSRGLRAFTPADFELCEFNHPHSFDSLLLAHVAEHMTQAEAIRLLQKYIGLLRPTGRLIIICPQELGFKADPTHVEFMDFEKIRFMAKHVGVRLVTEYSFPLPRLFGWLFRYNEFVFVGVPADREVVPD